MISNGCSIWLLVLFPKTSSYGCYKLMNNVKRLLKKYQRWRLAHLLKNNNKKNPQVYEKMESGIRILEDAGPYLPLQNAGANIGSDGNRLKQLGYKQELSRRLSCVSFSQSSFKFYIAFLVWWMHIAPFCLFLCSSKNSLWVSFAVLGRFFHFPLEFSCIIHVKLNSFLYNGI